MSHDAYATMSEKLRHIVDEQVDAEKGGKS
jgi:hypothetical protein